MSHANTCTTKLVFLLNFLMLLACKQRGIDSNAQTISTKENGAIQFYWVEQSVSDPDAAVLCRGRCDGDISKVPMNQRKAACQNDLIGVQISKKDTFSAYPTAQVVLEKMAASYLYQLKPEAMANFLKVTDQLFQLPPPSNSSTQDSALSSNDFVAVDPRRPEVCNVNNPVDKKPASGSLVTRNSEPDIALTDSSNNVASQSADSQPEDSQSADSQSDDITPPRSNAPALHKCGCECEPSDTGTPGDSYIKVTNLECWQVAHDQCSYTDSVMIDKGLWHSFVASRDSGEWKDVTKTDGKIWCSNL